MTHKSVQLIREGEHLAEVPVELEDVGEWGASMGHAGIAKLDRVRRALRAGNIRGALQEARVFRLVPESGDEDPALGFGENPQEPIER
jgi:predicted RecB family endonuclease